MLFVPRRTEGTFKSSIPVIPTPLAATDEPLVSESQPEQWRLPVLNRRVAADTPGHGRIRRLELILALAIAGFGYFSARTTKKQNALQNVGQLQNQALLNLAVSVANGNNKVNNLSKSVEAVTSVLARSSAQVGQISTQLEQRGSQIVKLTARLQTLEAASRTMQGIKAQGGTSNQPPFSVEPPAHETPTDAHEVSHFHPVDWSIPMPAGALAHQNAAGVLEYWLVSRALPSGDQFVKVVPYGVNSEGICVHSLGDGLDYTLNPNGNWISATDTRLVATSRRRQRSRRH